MTKREKNAVATGCDELFNRLTWALRKDREKLREAKQLYRAVCVEFQAQIEKADQ
jgi:hypothetical protein